MAVYVGFASSGGLVVHGDFNLVFLQNLSAFLVGIYTIKINKLGHTEKTSNEGIIAPGILTLLSAILCYGLADKFTLKPVLFYATIGSNQWNSSNNDFFVKIYRTIKYGKKI